MAYVYKSVKLDKKKSPINFYKWVSLMIIIFSAFALFLVASAYVNSHQSNNGNNKVANGFTIEQYDVRLDVKENNVVDVTENITINFYEGGHHGIKKIIPRWLKYTGKDDKSISRYSLIDDLKAVGNEYYTYTDNNDKEEIVIGSSDKTLDAGLYSYVIKYQYNMGKDPYKGFDEFIFHAYGDYWGTEIKNASLEVNMPKEIDANNIKFFGDKYRKNDLTNYVKGYVNGNTLYAQMSSDYQLMRSLTVDIELPDGYFPDNLTSDNYNNYSMGYCLIIIIITLLLLVLWLIFGKDHDKYSSTVEFYPPDDYDAASIGFIYNSNFSSSDVIATIFELADMGYIKINENKKKDKTIRTIINLCVDEKDRENKKKLSTIQELVYNKLFEKGNENIIAEDETFYKVFSDVRETLEGELLSTINDKNSYRIMFITSFLVAISVFFFYSAYFVYQDLNPKYNVLYFISFICLFLIVLFVLLMGRKSEYGEEIIARIKGFRDYIETAEKDQLEKLVEENPNYFYDILPYAYVLGVSSKWIENFENIKIPKNSYMGNFDYTDMSSLSDMSSSVYVPAGSSDSGSGGCSSCGGCGGGCSSCGGGGSW